MIHPYPDQPTSSPPFVYEFVATEPLPAFNPEITTKHLVLTKRQARLFNRWIARIRPLLMPTFVGGYLLRIAATFCSAELGRVLAPVSPLLQLPVVALVQLGFRHEYVLVLAFNFEFAFLVLSTTIWMVCFAFFFQDARALMLPMCWLEFVDLLLIETYFRDGGNVVFTAVIANCYLLALTFGVTIDGIDQGHYQDFTTGAAHSLSSKDLLLNTMGTILALMARLAYRKVATLRRKKRCPASTWTQSIGYRCRIALQRREEPLTNSTAPTTSDPVTTFVPDPSLKNLADAQSVPPPAPLLQMRFAQDSRTFDPEHTLIPPLTLRTALTLLQVRILYGGGILGFVLSVFAIYPGSTAYPVALQVSAVLALSLTVLFVAPFVSCSQRQLLRKLGRSFDFLFLYAQQIAAHLCMCDVLAWKWTHCCALAASFLWTHWVLTFDTIPPVLRGRLGLRTEFAVPVLATRMAMHIFFSYELLVWNQHKLQNRLLLDREWLGRRVRFYVVPFLLSRMITVFIWCVRILYRIATRKSPHELIIIMGNVEYDYVQWKQRQQQQQQVLRVNRSETPLAPKSPQELMTTTHAVRHTSSVVLFEPVVGLK